MLRHVPGELQGLFEGVHYDLRSDSVVLIEHIEYMRFVVVGELALELGVGRSEEVLGILVILNRTHYRLILVIIGVLLSEQLESELFADQEDVCLPELVVARLCLRVVYLALVLLELVATRNLEERA